jgi:hypothetical protein
VQSDCSKLLLGDVGLGCCRCTLMLQIVGTLMAGAATSRQVITPLSAFCIRALRCLKQCRCPLLDGRQWVQCHRLTHQRQILLQQRAIINMIRHSTSLCRLLRWLLQRLPPRMTPMLLLLLL